MPRAAPALLAAALAALAACDASDGDACVPACAERACGDDGCGGSCGTCGAGLRCDAAFACVPDGSGCVPACGGRACGEDGCGGSCGVCGTGLACDAGGACASASCPAGSACLAEEHTAVAYDCARAADGWSCTEVATLGSFDTYGQCIMACAEGQSACQENDTDVGARCRACEASCVASVDVACRDEAPGRCPAPCACR